MRKLKLYLVAICCLTSCNFTEGDKVIVLQPMGNYPKREAERILNQLQRINSKTTLRSNIDLPTSAYYPLRNRYRADSLISFLHPLVGIDTVIIGLSEKDISITKGKIVDFGVMGLGYRPGNSCVISTFRLSKAQLADQTYKLALHELGHTQGLPHCLNNTCLMRDAEGKNHLNQLIGFCSSCKTFLKNKGFKLI